jgi:hypothetical protein
MEFVLIYPKEKDSFVVIDIEDFGEKGMGF